MTLRRNICCYLVTMLMSFSIFAAMPVKSIVILGDSLSDNGNTAYLLRSLRQEENPAYLVYPLKTFVTTKMQEFADDYYIPQLVLDEGLQIVAHFFDHELAPMLATLISRINKIPALPGEPYWQDHFSNGPVWNEYLAWMLHIDTTNKKEFYNQAFAGSWAATYDHQLSVWNLIKNPLLSLKHLVAGKLIPPSLGLIVQANLLMSSKMNKDSIYFIFSGGNDYLNSLNFNDNYDNAAMNEYIENVLNSLENTIKKLIQAEARSFIILSVPDAGLTPRFIYTAEQSIISTAILEHNQRLKDRIDNWKVKWPDAHFIYIDVQTLFQKINDKPYEYGFSNTTEACIDVKMRMIRGLLKSPFAGNIVLEHAALLQYRGPELAPGEPNYHMCNEPQKYLFWDEVHPSTRAHRFLAQEICKIMQKNGYNTFCRS